MANSIIQYFNLSNVNCDKCQGVIDDPKEAVGHVADLVNHVFHLSCLQSKPYCNLCETTLTDPQGILANSYELVVGSSHQKQKQVQVADGPAVFYFPGDRMYVVQSSRPSDVNVAEQDKMALYFRKKVSDGQIQIDTSPDRYSRARSETRESAIHLSAVNHVLSTGMGVIAEPTMQHFYDTYEVFKEIPDLVNVHPVMKENYRFLCKIFDDLQIPVKIEELEDTQAPIRSQENPQWGSLNKVCRFIKDYKFALLTVTVVALSSSLMVIDQLMADGCQFDLKKD